MNVNIRQLDTHVDMEPSTYYAAFSAELEGSAAPMWALLTHLKEPGTADLTKRLLRHAYGALQQWHDAIGCPQTYVSRRPVTGEGEENCSRGRGGSGGVAEGACWSRDDELAGWRCRSLWVP